MIVTRLQNPLPGEPFAHEAAGFSYLATDFHYEHLVARLRRHLASTRGFYLVSGTPAPDGDLVERAINGHKDGRQRATLVRCRAGMTVDAVTRAYARQLGLTDERDNGQWSLLSRLMEDSRKGLVRVLVLENADALDDRGFDELHRFATLDDPHLLPVVLLTERGFVQRLDAPSLQFLQPAIVAHLALQQLETEEVAAFIRYQLNATEGRHERLFTRDVIAAIAAAAKGDPAAVNRLARHAAGIGAPPQLGTPAPQPVSTPTLGKIEPRLTLRPSEAVRPATPEPVAMKAPPPAPAPSMPNAVATPTKAPAAAAAGKNAAPAAWLKRARAMVPAATIAGYVVLAAGSAAGLFYLLAPGAEPDATVVAEAPQVQTVITSDLPLPAPRQVTPPAAEATPAIPAVPESAAVDPPRAAPEPPAAAAAPAPSVAEQPDAPAPAAAVPAPALAAIEPAAGGMPAAAESAAKAEPATPPVPPSTAAEPPAETVAKAEPTPTPVPPSTTAEPPAETVAKAEPAPTPVPPSTTATPPVETVAKAEAVPTPVPPSTTATPPVETVAKAEAVPTPVPPSTTAKPPVEALAKSDPAAPPPSVAAPPPATSVAKIEADPAPLPPRAADKPPSGAAAALVRRGEALLASGDIISARQFFARAAETGDAAAACGLGKSYDPVVLKQVRTRGVAGDPAKAAEWYRRAARAGSNEAAARLARLLVKFPQ